METAERNRLLAEGPQSYDDIQPYVDATDGTIEFWKVENGQRIFKYRCTVRGVTVSLSIGTSPTGEAGLDKQKKLDLMVAAHKIRTTVL